MFSLTFVSVLLLVSPYLVLKQTMLVDEVTNPVKGQA